MAAWTMRALRRLIGNTDCGGEVIAATNAPWTVSRRRTLQSERPIEQIVREQGSIVCLVEFLLAGYID